MLPNGDGEIRTHDPLLARQVLSQLSYTPTVLLHFLIVSLSANGLKWAFPRSEGLSRFRDDLSVNGLKWTRTTDLTLIRRAL